MAIRVACCELVLLFAGRGLALAKRRVANKKESSPMCQYMGEDWAKWYFNLWINKEYLIRRVDSHELMDKTVVRQSITIDFNAAYIKSSLARLEADGKRRQMTNAARRHWSHKIHRIPLILLKKSLFYDADLSDRANSSLHLCRRSSNHDTMAHIIVGLCLSHGVPGKFAKKCYAAVLDFLRCNDINEILKREKKLNNFASRCDIDKEGSELLQRILASLSDNYIQCVEVALDDIPTGVIKLAFSNTRTETTVTTSPRDNEANSRLSMGPVALFGKTDRTALLSRGVLNSNRPKGRKWEEFTRKLGVRATQIEVQANALGSRMNPAHVRIVAPPGTVIDDCTVYDHLQKPISSDGSNFVLKFRHERVVILDRNLPRGTYTVLLKMNPRRGSFLYQAAAIMLLLVLVLTFLLLSGPPSKLEDKTELAGAIFLIPTLLTTFAAKDSEHELMSQMLSFGRICVVVASILSVMAGLLVFSVYATKHSLHFRWIAFLALMMALLTSAFTLYLFIFQVIRIYAMRRAVQDRVNHYDSSGIIYNSIEGDPEEERRFIIFRDSAIACTVLMVAGALAIGFFGSGRLLTIWQLLSP